MSWSHRPSPSGPRNGSGPTRRRSWVQGQQSMDQPTRSRCAFRETGTPNWCPISLAAIDIATYSLSVALSIPLQGAKSKMRLGVGHLFCIAAGNIGASGSAATASQRGLPNHHTPARQGNLSMRETEIRSHTCSRKNLPTCDSLVGVVSPVDGREEMCCRSGGGVRLSGYGPSCRPKRTRHRVTPVRTGRSDIFTPAPSYARK